MGKKSRQKKLNQQTETPQQQQPCTQYLAIAVFVGLCILLFYPPFFRAMFFTRELLPTHIFTFILVILWCIVKITRKDASFLSTPLDYTVFAFALIYLITLPIAVNTRGAIMEFLKVTNYFFVYWLVSQIIDTDKKQNIILNVLIFSAFTVAVLGLGAAAGTWEVAGGYKSGRIFSTLQYPNSLAAYLTAALMLTIGLLQNSLLKFKRLYIVVAFILTITIILTYSRGGWLVVPAASFLYLLFIPKTKRSEAAATMGIVFFVSLVLTLVLGRLYLAEKGTFAWLIVFAGTGTVVALQYLATDLVRKVKPVFIAGTVIALILFTFWGTATYASRTLSQPLRLTHSRTEADSSKTFNEVIRLTPDTEYTLTMDLLAEGREDALYAWRVIVTGQDSEGKSHTLLDEFGNITEGWEAKEFTFTTPQNISQAALRLLNRYTDTSMEVRDVSLVSTNSSQEISFTWYRLMPNTLYNRFFGFSFSGNNVQTRFRYVRDAWKIVKDHPILGLGGHGWKARYFQYQSANYSSTEVHNHFMQVWVETGTIGLLIFLGIWLSFLYTAYNVYRNSKQDKKILAVGVGTAVIAVTAHSFYDFNLSLGAIGIFLWALMGTLRGIEKRQMVEPERHRSMYVNYLVVVMATVLLLFSFSLRLGYKNFVTGTRQLQTGKLSSGIATLEKAAKFDPFDPDIKIELAKAYAFMGDQTNSSVLYEKAHAQYENALTLNKYHPKYSHELGTFLIAVGRFNEGFMYLQNTIQLVPYAHQHYRYYANSLLNIAEYYLAQNDPQAAREYAQKVLPLENQMADYIEDTRPLAFAFGKAHFMLGNISESIRYLESAQTYSTDRADAAMALALIYEKLDDEKKAKQYYDRAVKWNPDSVTTYNSLKQI
ncbi:MAG: O-antigen ligase family protein [Bacillota bacterium]|nr:O-antigen ligase family protein [Bacillota bacterium]